MYLLAILLPPVALLFCGKPIQSLINIVLCLFLWIPGVVHAVLVVKEHKANQLMLKQVEMMKNKFK